MLSLLGACLSLPRQRQDPSEAMDVYLPSENSSDVKAEPSPSLWQLLICSYFYLLFQEKSLLSFPYFPFITHKHPTQISLRLFFFLFLSFFLVTTQQKRFSCIDAVTQAEQTIAPQCIPQKPEWSDSGRVLFKPFVLWSEQIKGRSGCPGSSAGTARVRHVGTCSSNHRQLA